MTRCQARARSRLKPRHAVEWLFVRLGPPLRRFGKRKEYAVGRQRVAKLLADSKNAFQVAQSILPQGGNAETLAEHISKVARATLGDPKSYFGTGTPHDPNRFAELIVSHAAREAGFNVTRRAIRDTLKQQHPTLYKLRYPTPAKRVPIPTVSKLEPGKTPTGPLPKTRVKSASVYELEKSPEVIDSGFRLTRVQIARAARHMREMADKWDNLKPYINTYVTHSGDTLHIIQPPTSEINKELRDPAANLFAHMAGSDFPRDKLRQMSPGYTRPCVATDPTTVGQYFPWVVCVKHDRPFGTSSPRTRISGVDPYGAITNFLDKKYATSLSTSEWRQLFRITAKVPTINPYFLRTAFHYLKSPEVGEGLVHALKDVSRKPMLEPHELAFFITAAYGVHEHGEWQRGQRNTWLPYRPPEEAILSPLKRLPDYLQRVNFGDDPIGGVLRLVSPTADIFHRLSSGLPGQERRDALWMLNEVIEAAGGDALWRRDTNRRLLTGLSGILVNLLYPQRLDDLRSPLSYDRLVQDRGIASKIVSEAARASRKLPVTQATMPIHRLALLVHGKDIFGSRVNEVLPIIFGLGNDAHRTVIGPMITPLHQEPWFIMHLADFGVPKDYGPVYEQVRQRGPAAVYVFVHATIDRLARDAGLALNRAVSSLRDRHKLPEKYRKHLHETVFDTDFLRWVAHSVLVGRKNAGWKPIADPTLWILHPTVQMDPDLAMKLFGWFVPEPHNPIGPQFQPGIDLDDVTRWNNRGRGQ